MLTQLNKYNLYKQRVAIWDNITFLNLLENEHQKNHFFYKRTAIYVTLNNIIIHNLASYFLIILTYRFTCIKYCIIYSSKNRSFGTKTFFITILWRSDISNVDVCLFASGLFGVPINMLTCMFSFACSHICYNYIILYTGPIYICF